MKVLFSFVGNRDPYIENSQEYGPVLSLLDKREFSRVYLFCTGPEYIERARSIEAIKKEEGSGINFKFVGMELESPIDYEEIFGKLKASVDEIVKLIAHENPEISILLDPGTPQMQTVWFILVKGGYLDAKLLQGVPPKFAGGAYMVREIVLDESAMPRIKVVFEEEGEDTGKKKGGEDRGKWLVSESELEIIGSSRSFKEVLEKAGERDGHSLLWIVPLSLNRSSRVSSSVTRREHLPVRNLTGLGCSGQPMAERFSWTRLASFL